MASYILLLSFASFLFCSACGFASSADVEETKIYIAYLGGSTGEEHTTAAVHARILQDVGISKQSVVRSYTKSFSGFAAYVTEEQQQALAAHDEVVSVFPSTNLQLLTTESWDFMGFPVNVPRNPAVESDIIIGVLDSGIWPESDSFKDHGFNPPPKKWKGVCNGGSNFTCNNKIVGARFYTDSSARDLLGHGTHTASIAAGNEVQNASFYGIAQGIARGGVPGARIAVYKVCDSKGCTQHNVLAAFDDAIADGVDIFSISTGASMPIPIERDAIAIGSFHAAEKGILTVNAAGNEALIYNISGTSSVAPWLFSVAASTTKRQILNTVKLGDGTELLGYTINSFDLQNKRFPLVYGKDASKENCRESDAQYCRADCVDSEKVKGKIVICGWVLGISVVIDAGAIGSIMQKGSSYDVSDIVPFPASILTPQDYATTESYYNSTEKPEAIIYTSQLKEDKTAPRVAYFSSRGPNAIFPEILKPDITAPGVDILAAFSPVVPPSSYSSDKRSVPFSLLTGTSVACPHVAGAAAYVKSKHPDWSPSAVKSALMTTAFRMNNDRTWTKVEEFSYGAGFIDPLKAVNPGLVYETTKMDYVKMLCSLGYDNATLGKIFRDNTTCPQGGTLTPRDLNYPAMVAKVDGFMVFSANFSRTVTNVGLANSTYKATIVSDIAKVYNCSITVEPNVLSFKELNEKQSFAVSVSCTLIRPNTELILFDMISASLEWSNGVNIVRSPIVVFWKPS